VLKPISGEEVANLDAVQEVGTVARRKRNTMREIAASLLNETSERHVLPSHAEPD
jgi:hypothetical protein